MQTRRQVSQHHCRGLTVGRPHFPRGGQGLRAKKARATAAATIHVTSSKSAPMGPVMELWTLAKAKTPPLELELVPVVAALPLQLDQLSPTEISRLSWAMARLKYYDKGLLSELTSLLTKRVRHFGGEGVAACLWGLAKFNEQEGTKAMLAAVAKDVGPRCVTFSSHSLVSILWSYAHLRLHLDVAFLTDLAQALQGKIDTLTPQGMSNMVWAFATLGYVLPEKALDATAEQALGRLEHFTPQQLANLSWGWAMMSSMPESLQEGIMRASLHKLPHFKAQELFNLAYALATIRYCPEELLDAIAVQATLCLSELNSQELANLLWAFAKLDHRSEDTYSLLHASAEEIMHRPAWDTRNLPVILWSYGRLGWSAPIPVLSKMASMLFTAREELQPQDIVMAAVGFAEQGFLPAELLYSLIKMVARQVGRWQAYYLVRFVWALAQLGISPRPIWDVLAAQPSMVQHLTSSLYPKESQQLFWALVVCGCTSGPLYEETVKGLQLKWEHGSKARPARDLVFAALLASQETKKPILKKLCRQAAGSYYVLKRERRLDPSDEEAIRILQAIGVVTSTLVPLNCIQVLVPIVAQMPAAACALELIPMKDIARIGTPDGKQGQQVKGRALIRHRLIRSQGMEVLAISQDSWQAEIRAGTEQQFLQRLLQPFA